MKITRIGELPEFFFEKRYEFKYWKGSQTPTPVLTDEGLKLSFSARDVHGKTSCFSYLLNPDNPLEVIKFPKDYDFTVAQELGWFYSDGFMISQYLNDQAYFTGWEDLGGPVKYMTSCGKAYKNEIASTPFLARTSIAPCGSSMPFVDGSTCYYMALDKWNLGESYYFIASYYKTAQGYSINEKVIPRFNYEGGLARPVIFNLEDRKMMMFSARGKSKFRIDKSESYKLWLAEFDGASWIRQKDQLTIESTDNDLMQCYGHPFKINNKMYLFYNNHFRSPIQIAEIKL